MQITTCLLVLFSQSGAESCQLVSSLSAYEHLYFDYLSQICHHSVYLTCITFFLHHGQSKNGHDHARKTATFFLRRFHFHSSWFTKSIYINVSVCLSIYMYDSLRNTVIKKNLCETQLRFEGQKSALICAQNFHCWTFLTRIKKVSN